MNVNKWNKCNHKNFKHIEYFWDYDGALVEECDDCGRKINRFTRVEFETAIQYPEYWMTYQFNKDWDLVGYSQWKASWLKVTDDLWLIENNLRGNRWIDWAKELTFIPLKDLTIPHIKNILMNVPTIKKEYKAYFLNRLEWVINI